MQKMRNRKKLQKECIYKQALKRLNVALIIVITHRKRNERENLEKRNHNIIINDCLAEF